MRFVGTPEIDKTKPKTLRNPLLCAIRDVDVDWLVAVILRTIQSVPVSVH
jgi:hypothetical protein